MLKLDKLILITLFITAFMYLLYGLGYIQLQDYLFDEGIYAYGAERILAGDLPYRDVWTYHALGNYYILAMLFKFLGINLRTFVLFSIFTYSIIACLIFIILKAAHNRTAGFLGFIICIAYIKFYMVFNRPYQLAMLFYFVCCLCFLEYLKTKSKKSLALVGFTCGVIGFFRIDFQFYSLISLFLVFLLNKINTLARGEKASIRLLYVLNGAQFLLLGFMIPFLINTVIFVRLGGSKFFNDYILSGLWLRSRFLPFYTFKHNVVLLYIPLAIFLVTFCKLILTVIKIKERDIKYWIQMLLLISGCFFYLYACLRTDLAHLFPSMVAAIILFVLMLVDLVYLSNHRHLGWTVCFLFCLWLAIYSMAPYYGTMKAINTARNLNIAKLNIERAKGFYDLSKNTQNQISAIKYIQSRTNKENKILVTNLKHDRVIYNDVMFYFLSGRPSATKYYRFEPGFTNTEVIQREIISDLKKNKVQYIVQWVVPDNVYEPNESSISSGVTDLDDFIQKNYLIDKRFGDYLILRHI